MGRKDQLGLDQGEDQGADDHQADTTPDLPVDPGHHQHGDEGHDGGEDAEGDRNGDLLGPPDGAVDPESVPLRDGIDVFPDHDGIVDHDTDDDEEAEKGDHVDGDVHEGHGHQPEGAEEGKGNAEADPDGQLQAEEEGQGKKNKDESAHAIAQEHGQAVLEEFGSVGPDLECNALGQGPVLFLHVGLGGLGHVEGTLLARPGARGCRRIFSG